MATVTLENIVINGTLFDIVPIHLRRFRLLGVENSALESLECSMNLVCVSDVIIVGVFTRRCYCLLYLRNVRADATVASLKRCQMRTRGGCVDDVGIWLLVRS